MLISPSASPYHTIEPDMEAAMPINRDHNPRTTLEPSDR
jgi:hypothetical protein